MKSIQDPSSLSSMPRTNTKVAVMVIRFPIQRYLNSIFFMSAVFLWRYYLFARMLMEKVPLKLDKSFIAFLRKMLVMLDTALEQIIFCCLQTEDGQLEVDQRFPLFDIYLTTEFVIGHHDPKSVDLWCKHHGAKDLERMDPFRFGT